MIKNGFVKKQTPRSSVFSEQVSCLYKTGLSHYRYGREWIVWYKFIIYLFS